MFEKVLIMLFFQKRLSAPLCFILMILTRRKNKNTFTAYFEK